MFKKIFLFCLLFSTTALAQIDVDYMRSGLPNPNWRDFVANSGALPTTNNNLGDVRFSIADLGLYGWDGSSWQSIVSGGGGNFLPIAGGTMTGGLVLNPLTQITTNSAATVGQLQSFVSGLVWKSPACQAAATVDVNIANPSTDTFDGNTLALNESLCLFNQAALEENGIYIFDTDSTPLVRRTDADSGAELNAATISVQNGTVYGGRAFTQVTETPNVGTDPIIFVELGNSYINGAGLDLTGNIFSIATGGIVNSMVNAAAAIDGTKIDPDFGSQNVVTTGTGSFESVQITGSAGAGFVEFNRQNASPSAPADGFKLFSSNSDGLSFIGAAGNSAEFRPNLLTGNHVYNLPNANGIVALIPSSGFVTSNGTSLSNQPTIDLGLDVSGVLDVSMGGTGSTSYTLGSVVFANASQLTEDNANFFYDDGNNRLGLGTTSPSFKLQLGGSAGSSYLQRDPLGAYISGSASSPTKLIVETTFGSGVAAELALSSRPSGAMGAFEELGWLSFFGRDDAGNQRRGAYIRGITSGAWTSTSLPTHMDFFTVPSGSNSEIQRMRLHSSGELYIGNTGSVSNVGTISISPVLTTSVGLDIRAIGGQTADLLRIRNSGGTTIANIEADGDLNARSLKANGTIGAGFLELADQAVPVTAPTSAIRVFSNSGNFAVKTSSPIYTFDHSVLSTSRTFQFIDSDYIIANVPATIGPVKSSGSDLTTGLIDLVSETTGTLAINQGGTGQVSFAAGYISSNGSALSSTAYPSSGIVTSNGSAFSSITFPSSGVVTSNGSALSSFVREVVKTTITQQTTSATPVASTELVTSSLPVGKYRFEAVIVFQSATAGNGAGFRLGAGTASMANTYGKWSVAQAAAGTAHNFEYNQIGTATATTATNVAAINSDQVATVSGVFDVTSQGTVRINFRSENAGQAVSIRAGSFLAVEAI